MDLVTLVLQRFFGVNGNCFQILLQPCQPLEFSLTWVPMVLLWAELSWRSVSWFACLGCASQVLKSMNQWTLIVDSRSFALMWCRKPARTFARCALVRRALGSRGPPSTGSFPTSCARWLVPLITGWDLILELLAGRRLHCWKWHWRKVYLRKQVRRWELQPEAHGAW